MVDILPIAITILKIKGDYLFIKRRQHPYKNLWSLVGGKINAGEHISEGAVREICEETGVRHISNYKYRGFVSERLLIESVLRKHFLIFVGYAEIQDYEPENREGALKPFSTDDIISEKDMFLPSDWHMFHAFETLEEHALMYEAELVYKNEKYELIYFRKAEN